MKAIIAAAGRGTRMQGLSKDKPKHLIEVAGKPFLYYVLKNLKEGGVEKFILVVGYHAEAMEKFAKNYRDEFQITLVNQFEKFGEEKYGTSVPVEVAESETKNEPFLAIYGDNLYSPKDVKRLIETDDFNYISVIRHEHPEKYGVAVTDENGFLTKIVEKPKEYVSNFINTGLYKFTPEIFNEVKKVQKSPRGEYELTDAVQKLAERRRVKVLKLEDYWMDFGKPEDIEKVEQFLKKQKNK
ncbi:MAG: sugar phosphate nucleotidyltransferase [Nanoarchaeota archaeon]|nr:sugar phosphate nucleotidyltransferase [Nanoarchaeota archaeon]